MVSNFFSDHLMSKTKAEVDPHVVKGNRLWMLSVALVKEEVTKEYKVMYRMENTERAL